MEKEYSISLRNFIGDLDLPFFHKVHSDSNSMKYYGMLPFENIEQSRELMNNYIQSELNMQSYHRVICDIISNEYLGEIGLFNINRRNHRADAYCILLPEQRKKGISIQASDLFYREVFEKLPINRVQALVYCGNIGAKKSLIGIGYLYEGTLSEYEYFNGKYIDIDVFALLKERFYEMYGK